MAGEVFLDKLLPVAGEVPVDDPVPVDSPAWAAARRSKVRTMAVRTVALSALTTLAMAGCAPAEPRPSTLPPVTPVPSALGSPVAIPVSGPASGPASVPKAAQAATSAGAGKFARFWYDNLNAAARSGDVRALEALALPSCSSCEQFATGISSLYRSGGRIEGGVFTVTAAETPAVRPGAVSARVTVLYDVSPTRQLGRGGEILRSVPALTAVVMEMRLERRANSWLVTEIVPD